jgi:SP family arabinose:H+ symporter-like MFS transporter
VPDRRFLWSLAVIASLGGFLFGYDTAVISGTIGFVKAQFGLDSIMEGWYVSSAIVGCITGVAVAGPLSDWSGRKRALFLSAILFFVSAVGCALAPGHAVLIAFRLIGGIGVGVASMLSPLYISEISPPALRGRLVALYQLAITVGILCSYFVNAWLLGISESASTGGGGLLHLLFAAEVWRGMLGSETVPAVAFLLLLFVVPESPRWLVARGRLEEAEKIVARIEGPDAARTEIADIAQMVGQESGSVRELWRPGIRSALVIGVVLAFLTQVSGINAIIYYGPRILESAGFTLGDALGGQVVIGFVNVAFTFVAIGTIDRFGRRPLLIYGVSGIVLALIVIGALFALGMTEGVLLMAFILLFIACFAFSFGPVAWVLLSEFYPTRVRGRAMSIATIALWSGTALVGQLVPWLLETLGPHGTFWLFAALCSPGIYIGWKLVPETRGRSLEDIERYWLSTASTSADGQLPTADS